MWSIPTPPAFPGEAYNRLSSWISVNRQYDDLVLGWYGIAVRYAGAVASSRDYQDLHDLFPPDRTVSAAEKIDHEVFQCLNSIYSSLECLAYVLFCLRRARITGSATLPSEEASRAGFRHAIQAASRFPEPLATALNASRESYSDLSSLRNVMTHRAAGFRAYHELGTIPFIDLRPHRQLTVRLTPVVTSRWVASLAWIVEATIDAAHSVVVADRGRSP